MNVEWNETAEMWVVRDRLGRLVAAHTDHQQACDAATSMAGLQPSECVHRMEEMLPEHTPGHLYGVLQEIQHLFERFEQECAGKGIDVAALWSETR